MCGADASQPLRAKSDSFSVTFSDEFEERREKLVRLFC